MAATKEAADGALEAEEAGGGGRRAEVPRRALLAGVAVAVAAGLGGGAYYFLAGREAPTPAASTEPSAAKPPAFLDLPEVMVNLSVGEAERTQYLKVRAVLELEDATHAPKVQPYLPRIIDAFQTFLRELRPSDLEGSAGIYRLREELTRRVNVSIAPLRVNAVLFKELVIQ